MVFFCCLPTLYRWWHYPLLSSFSVSLSGKYVYSALLLLSWPDLQITKEERCGGTIDRLSMIQWLTIAIDFELIYYLNANSLSLVALPTVVIFLS